MSSNAPPEPASAPAAGALELVEATSRVLRYSRLSIAVVILAVIALVAAMYLARAFFVPLLIGILASYTLSPLVDWLKKWRLPGAVAAAIVMGVLIGGGAWVAVSLSDQTVAMIEKLPDAAHRLRERLSKARSGNPSALQNIQQAANEIQGAAGDAGAKPGARVVVVKAAEPGAWLRDYALTQSALLFTVAAQLPMVLLLTYFLLASGTHFRRKLIGFVGPSLSRKKDVVMILEEIDVQVQRYLLTMLASNTLVAIGTWLAFEALGLEQAGVWGVAAGVLHFIPYLGTVALAFGSGVAAFLQMGTLLDAFIVASVSLLVAGAIGLGFMTWLQSRFARVNAAVLFIALLFFAWLWGVWGLLLGAPLVAIMKVICDRVESLKAFGALMGQ